MNLKIPLRLGRILVVLALIVALLGSSIPVPARAVGTGLLYNIAANTGANLALRAIGVGPGNSPEVFNNLVTTIGEAVSSATAPLAQLLIAGSSGNFRSFMSTDFLSWILSWLFDSGTLLDSGGIMSATLYDSFVDIVNTYSSSFSPCYVNVLYSDTDIWVYMTSSPISLQGSVWKPLDGSSGYLFRRSSSHTSFSKEQGVWSSVNNWSFTCVTMTPATLYNPSLDPPTTEQDLTLDSVGNSLDAAPYTDWVANSVTYDSSTFAPVSVPSLDAADISAQAQGAAQVGTIPDAVVDEVISGAEVDPDVVTLSDIFTAIRSLGADVVEAIQAVPAAIAAIFEPPVIYDQDGNVLPAYQISLTDFFPFCLPFDIYDLLSALAADPVAPVFEWTISVPRWGISHDIEIDLSEWDSIARLFRTFELAAFVLGLALITREKFLRS